MKYFYFHPYYYMWYKIHVGVHYFLLLDSISLYRHVIVYQFICWWPSASFETLTDANNKTAVDIHRHLFDHSLLQSLSSQEKFGQIINIWSILNTFSIIKRKKWETKLCWGWRAGSVVKWASCFGREPKLGSPATTAFKQKYLLFLSISQHLPYWDFATLR